ncbi:MAG: alpha/beta fold hydrolase [bacterium]
MRLIINNLAVYEFGNKDNPTVLLIHGFPFDYRMWEHQINALQNDYFVIAYDCRGLGQSYVGDGQYTMEAYVNDLFSIMDGLNLNKVVLCGLSMGGYIALRAVEKQMHRFTALILCDTKASPDDDAAKIKRADAINQINVDGLDQFVSSSVPNTLCAETIENNQQILKTLIARAKSQDPAGVKGAQYAILSRTSTEKFLKKIKIPTLVIVGQFDALTPPDIMRKMAGTIPNSQFAVVPKAGHMSPLENPDFVNNVIKEFLDKKK